MALFQTTKEREARQCPPPPAAYPWLLFYNGNGFRDQSFHTISHPPSNQYFNDLKNSNCVRSVPELCNKVVWNSCHGWLILSDDDNSNGQFSLFNPVTLECILLPPRNYNLDPPQTTIETCTLSSPPTDPSCILFVFYRGLRRILMCHLENKHWTEKRYDEEIEAIDERPISSKDSLRLSVFCKGKLYASTRTYSQLVSIDVVEQDPINLVLKPMGIGLPWNYEYSSTRLKQYLVESDGDIYFINIIRCGSSSTDGFHVDIFKLDLTSVIWERMESIKDRVFFLCSKYAISCPTDEVGGTCVYFTLFLDESLYAYNIEDDSVSVFLPCPYLDYPWKSPIWVMPDLRLTNGDRGKAVHINGKKRAKPRRRRRRRRRRRQRKEVVEKGEDEKILEAKERLNLLDLPSDILKSICRLLMPVDYMKFLAVSTMTRRLAPHSEWRTAMSYPWLVNFERNNGVVSLFDPYHNDKYRVRVPKSLENVQLCYCKDGWLLMCQLSTTTYRPDDRYQPRLIFFNPFTKETIMYPTFPFLKFYLSQFGFSSSPSSSNCAVVAVSWDLFTVGIYTSRSREEEWRYFAVRLNIPMFQLDFMSYPIFVDGAFYFMSEDGRLGVLRTKGSDNNNDGFSWEIPQTTPSKFWWNRNFLVECDGQLLSVFVVDNYEGRVEVFKLNSNTLVWERVHSLGNRTLYISHSSTLSAEAKFPQMEEKIYLPRFYEQAIVSYSLATGLYHYSSGSEEVSLEDFYGTRHQPFSGWILPRWL